MDVTDFNNYKTGDFERVDAEFVRHIIVDAWLDCFSLDRGNWTEAKKKAIPVIGKKPTKIDKLYEDVTFKRSLKSASLLENWSNILDVFVFRAKMYDCSACAFAESMFSDPGCACIFVDSSRFKCWPESIMAMFHEKAHIALDHVGKDGSKRVDHEREADEHSFILMREFAKGTPHNTFGHLLGCGACFTLRLKRCPLEWGWRTEDHDRARRSGLIRDIRTLSRGAPPFTCDAAGPPGQ